MLVTPLETLTRDDVVRAGACPEGVDAWLQRCRPIPTTLSVAKALLKCRDDKERDWVRRAARLDGFGDGDGYGYGGGGGGYGGGSGCYGGGGYGFGGYGYGGYGYGGYGGYGG